MGDVEAVFAGKGPEALATYEALVAALRSFGPFVEEPKKTSIHLVARTAFAGIATRRSSLILTLKSAKDIRSARIENRDLLQRFPIDRGTCGQKLPRDVETAHGAARRGGEEALHDGPRVVERLWALEDRQHGSRSRDPSVACVHRAVDGDARARGEGGDEYCRGDPSPERLHGDTS